MKKIALAAIAALVVGSASARDASQTLPTVLPSTANIFSPSNTLANPHLNGFRADIATVTNQLNHAAARLGVSSENQVQWTGAGGIGADFGALYESIDRSAAPNGTALTFNAETWTVTSTTPITIDDVVNNAIQLGDNIGEQIWNTVDVMGGVISSQVVAYNGIYAVPGSPSTNTAAEKLQDYNIVRNYAVDTKSAVDNARNFYAFERFLDLTGVYPETLNDIASLRSTNVTYPAAGGLTYQNVNYNSYTDFVLSKPTEGVATPN